MAAATPDPRISGCIRCAPRSMRPFSRSRSPPATIYRRRCPSSALPGSSRAIAGVSELSGQITMDGWTETCRDVVSPWECDVTEHFTIAYYFDRLADAASTIADSLGLHDVSRSVARRFDVRFARELRAGASFHILSGAIALDDRSVRLGHRVVDSANGEVTAWVEETLDITAASLPREIHDAVSQRLLHWEGPLVERRPEPTTVEGFVPTMRS